MPRHGAQGARLIPPFCLPSRRSIVPTCIFVFLLAYFFSSDVAHLFDRVRQTHPFSFQYQIEQPFAPTSDEIACLHGDPSGILPGSGSSSSSGGGGGGDKKKDPIPNVVHFIYGLRNPATHPGAGTFDFLCYLAVRSAVVALRPDAVYLHYTYLSDPPSADPGADPLSNGWIKRLAPHIKLVHHPPEEFEAGQGHWQAAHVSDVLRLELLDRQGGIYLDIDAFALRPFGDVLRGPRDVVLGHEGGNRWGLCNAIMAARPGSSFVKSWLKRYDGADLSREWNYHSVTLPKEMERTEELGREVCALSPDAFFWPTWTWHHVDWMHERLDAKEAEKVRGDISRNGGSLFEGQLAYHAWNQMSWDRYLKYLTPQKVRREDTRFNLLMRRFMEDDI